MKSLFAVVAMLVALTAVIAASPAQAQIAPGQCARLTNGGRLEKVLGPSNVEGQWMVRDARLSGGTGQSLSPGQFTIIPCPGAPQGEECFASTPDESGNTPDQRAIIHILRTNMTRVHREKFAIRFTALDVGAPRAPSLREAQDILDRAADSNVLDVRATFDTCTDDGSVIRTEHHEQKLMCYNTSDGQGMTCGSIYNPDVTAPVTEEHPKFPDQQ